MAIEEDEPTTGMPPDVLVVVVNYNGGELLSRAVAALARQSYRSFRLLIVDNASSDDSISRLHAEFPETEVLQTGSNMGFAAANNLAVRSAGGTRWIGLLNPDAFPEPDWLQNLIGAARKNPNAGSFASRTLVAGDPEKLDGAGDAYHVAGRYWRRGYHRKKQDLYLQSEEIFAACGAAALYSREAWEDVGGFDEDFFCYGEDIDLGFRLQLAGYKCLYVPEAVALHCGSAVTGQRSDFSTYYGQRNLSWVYFKNMPAPLFWLVLPLHVLLNFATVLRCMLRGQGGVVIRAKKDSALGLPAMWRKRSEIQRKRKIGSVRLLKVLELGWPGSLDLV